MSTEKEETLLDQLVERHPTRLVGGRPINEGSSLSAVDFSQKQGKESYMFYFLKPLYENQNRNEYYLHIVLYFFEGNHIKTAIYKFQDEVSFNSIKNEIRTRKDNCSIAEIFEYMKDNIGNALIIPIEKSNPAKEKVSESNETNHERDGFRKSEKQPLPFNTFAEKGVENFSYLSELALPEQNFENKYYTSLDQTNKKKLCNTAQRVYLVYVNDMPVGTAVAVGRNIFLTAKHCLDGLTEQTKVWLVAKYLSGGQACCFYPVLSHNLYQHPSEDAVLMFASGNPFRALPSTDINCIFEEQPGGGYYILHHAAGLPLQVSSGTMPGSNYYQFEHLLLADAGPLASGAGVFDADNVGLIGINTERKLFSDKVNICRRILLLHTIKEWFLNTINAINNKSEEQELIKPETRTPYPLLITAELENSLNKESLETITWIRASRQAKAMQQFLLQLNDHLKGKTTAEIEIPEFLNINSDSILDTHAPKHLGKNFHATRIRKFIGSNVNHPVLKAVASVIENVYNLFNSRIPEDKRNEFLSYTVNIDADLWAIDFDPVVIGYDKEGDPCTIAKIQSNVTGFHFFPINAKDTAIIQNKVNVINANKVLPHVIEHENNIERDHTFYNQPHYSYS